MQKINYLGQLISASMRCRCLQISSKPVIQNLFYSVAPDKYITISVAITQCVIFSDSVISLPVTNNVMVPTAIRQQHYGKILIYQYKR